MSAHISIHSRQSAGKIKPVNGGCLAPPLAFENIGQDIRKEFAALHLPITRLHDAPLENPGLNLVDVSMIFPLFHADADDPRNYNFKATDDYIRNCLECGTQIFYRLGVSIDHSYNKYVIEPPPDTAKWIEIVTHIIRHYNEGWADGFHWEIAYWEIWNEAEGISGEGRHLHTMWDAPVESYYDFYLQVARTLKQRFPHLKIGGPSNCQWVPCDGRSYGREFIDLCAAHQAPLDFYSIHFYASDMEWIAGCVRDIRAYLDANGFSATELHCTEWSYLPRNGFARMRETPESKYEVIRQMKDANAAAFITGCLIQWQDLPVDMGYLYTVTGTDFGLFLPVSMQPGKSYYGMKAFGELAKFFPERIAVEVELTEEKCADPGDDRIEFAFRALGGRDAAGNCGVLLSVYNYGRQEVSFDFDRPEEFRSVEVYLVDERHDLTRIICCDNPCGSITVPVETDSAVLWIKGYKKL